MPYLEYSTLSSSLVSITAEYFSEYLNRITKKTFYLERLPLTGKDEKFIYDKSYGIIFGTIEKIPYFVKYVYISNGTVMLYIDNRYTMSTMIPLLRKYIMDFLPKWLIDSDDSRILTTKEENLTFSDIIKLFRGITLISEFKREIIFKVCEKI